MFSDLKHELFPENRSTKVPETVLKGLLPDSLKKTGAHYEAVGKRSVVLVEDLKKVKFGFGDKIIKRAVRKIEKKYPELSEIYIEENLSKIFYRTQTKINIFPEDEIFVKDKKIRARDLMKDAITGQGLTECTIGSEAFKGKIQLDMQISGKPITFVLTQQVFPSAEKQIFDTVNQKILKVKLIVPDNRSKGVSIQFNINLDAANDIKEIMDIKPLIAALIEDGNITLYGENIIKDKSVLSELTPILRQLEIYEMLDKVGTAYNKKFPVNWNLTEQQFRNLQILYFSETTDDFFVIPAFNVTFHVPDVSQLEKALGEEISLTENRIENFKIDEIEISDIHLLRVFYKYKLEGIGKDGCRLVHTPNSRILIKVIDEHEDVSRKKVSDLLKKYEIENSK